MSWELMSYGELMSGGTNVLDSVLWRDMPLVFIINLENTLIHIHYVSEDFPEPFTRWSSASFRLGKSAKFIASENLRFTNHIHGFRWKNYLSTIKWWKRMLLTNALWKCNTGEVLGWRRRAPTPGEVFDNQKQEPPQRSPSTKWGLGERIYEVSDHC